MQMNKRESPRYSPSDLTAVITISPPAPSEWISLKGTVLDMSQKGIRIKLYSAMPNNIPESKVLITIVMPKSGLEVKIHGSIRHISEETEYGVHYHKEHCKEELNNLLFECVKLN